MSQLDNSLQNVQYRIVASVTVHGRKYKMYEERVNA